MPRTLVSGISHCSTRSADCRLLLLVRLCLPLFLPTRDFSLAPVLHSFLFPLSPCDTRLWGVSERGRCCCCCVLNVVVCRLFNWCWPFKCLNDWLLNSLLKCLTNTTGAPSTSPCVSTSGRASNLEFPVMINEWQWIVGRFTQIDWSLMSYGHGKVTGMQNFVSRFESIASYSLSQVRFKDI